MPGIKNFDVFFAVEASDSVRRSVVIADSIARILGSRSKVAIAQASDVSIFTPIYVLQEGHGCRIYF